MARWEQRPVLVNGTFIQPIPMDQGGKENMPYQEFPKMLYKAERADGGPRISESLIVDSEQAETNALSRGWCVGQEGAIDPQVGEAFCGRPFRQVGVHALAAHHQGRQQANALVAVLAHDARHDGVE
jgi:hypothetical protein